jgi:DNA-directed RNA polymerase specialized sigma24 family protein
MSQDDALTDDEFLDFLVLIATIMLGEHAAMADDVVCDSIDAMQMARRRLIDPEKMRTYLIQAVTNKSRSMVRRLR